MRIRACGSWVSANSPDLQIVIGPRIEHWVSENRLTREALVALQAELGDSSPMYTPLLTRLLEVSEEPGKERRSGFRPGLPGYWALGRYSRTTRKPPHAR